MYKIFIHENASENIACEMAAILARGGRVNKSSVFCFMHATPSHYHNKVNLLTYNEHMRWTIQYACVNAC